MMDSVVTLHTNHPSLKKIPFAWLAVGLLIGVSQRVVHTATNSPEKPKNPNVVVLRSERFVTIQGSLTTRELAEALAKTTGLKFTTDASYQKEETKYGILLSKVPLSYTLRATGYLLKGQWERKSNGYHLRPLTPVERTLDLTEYEALVDLSYRYLSQIDLKDPSLSKSEQMMISSWLMARQSQMNELVPLSIDTTSGWMISKNNEGFTVSYGLTDPETGQTKGRGQSWTLYQ